MKQFEHDPVSKIEKLPEPSGIIKALLFDKALKEKIKADPVAMEGMEALKRLLKNTIVLGADFVPVLGSVLSWGADAMKLSKKKDITPDVSRLVAWGTNIIDVVSFDTIPSYWIQSLLQAKKDLPRVRKLLEIVKQIRQGEREDHQRNKGTIDTAMATFDDPEGKSTSDGAGKK